MKIKDLRSLLKLMHQEKGLTESVTSLFDKDFLWEKADLLEKMVTMT